MERYVPVPRRPGEAPGAGGEVFWSVCPGENAVIRYACQNMKVDLRIGGKDAQTFVNPQHICQYNGDLYVACGGNKIRKIDGMDYTVSDYRTFLSR